MGISHIHVFHKKPTRREPTTEVVEKRADSSSCSLYVAPKMGDTVDSLQPLPITWNSTCLTDAQLDIYLLSPTSDYPRIHLWENVANSGGSYTADIMPRWWNATSSQSLQISIVPHGNPLFMSTFAAGPVFTATYTAPSTGTPDAANVNQIDSGVTLVNNAAKKTMTSGKTAAAVLIPLLFIILCIGAYIKLKRSKGIEKRKRWTEAVDKRMSTISTDWKSVSAAGANAAIRNSIAVGNRNSSFSFGAIRPSSTIAVEGEDAGAAGVGSQGRQMSQMRTGVGLRNPAAMSSTERVSRVSFAPDTRVSRVSFADSRPSGESRRTRAFHSAYIPPVPALPDNADEAANDNSSEENQGQFSPRQTQGPLTLTPEDIRSRIAAGKSKNSTQENGNEFSEIMPALSMMRTGGNSSEPDDLLLSTPAPLAPTYPKPVITTPQAMASPVMSTMPMQPMPANVMSPDEMLRAYAERKKSMAGHKSITPASISYPMPVANSGTAVPSTNNNNMRVLYNAATGNISPTNTGNGSNGTNTEYAPSEYSGAESYQQAVGNQYAFGHHPNASIGVGAYGGAQYAIGDDEDDISVMGRAAYAGHAA
ncbi:hypothetical protein BDZ97DRAFT_1654857 [Flammula alnicola]|nr:hypothetical protein BDZ97DRAFT_1654857 [Flammula alnicola]